LSDHQATAQPAVTSASGAARRAAGSAPSPRAHASAQAISAVPATTSFDRSASASAAAAAAPRRASWSTSAASANAIASRSWLPDTQRSGTSNAKWTASTAAPAIAPRDPACRRASCTKSASTATNRTVLARWNRNGPPPEDGVRTPK
jgi:hypothetical protein